MNKDFMIDAILKIQLRHHGPYKRKGTQWYTRRAELSSKSYGELKRILEKEQNEVQTRLDKIHSTQREIDT